MARNVVRKSLLAAGNVYFAVGKDEDYGKLVGLNVEEHETRARVAPDEGESLADIESNSKDSMLLPALVELRYPTGQGSETAVELRSSPKTSTMRTITHEEETTLWRTTVCP